MPRQTHDSRGRENNITITAGDTSVETNAAEMKELADRLANGEGPNESQTEMSGDGYDVKPEIQAIRSAADRFLDVQAEAAGLKERKSRAELDLMGKMCAAKRFIYTHKGKTFSIEDNTKLKIKPAVGEKARKPRRRREE